VNGKAASRPHSSASILHHNLRGKISRPPFTESSSSLSRGRPSSSRNTYLGTKYFWTTETDQQLKERFAFDEDKYKDFLAKLDQRLKKKAEEKRKRQELEKEERSKSPKIKTPSPLPTSSQRTPTPSSRTPTIRTPTPVRDDRKSPKLERSKRCDHGDQDEIKKQKFQKTADDKTAQLKTTTTTTIRTSTSTTVSRSPSPIKTTITTSSIIRTPSSLSIDSKRTTSTPSIPRSTTTPPVPCPVHPHGPPTFYSPAISTPILSQTKSSLPRWRRYSYNREDDEEKKKKKVEEEDIVITTPSRAPKITVTEIKEIADQKVMEEGHKPEAAQIKSRRESDKSGKEPSSSSEGRKPYLMHGKIVTSTAPPVDIPTTKPIGSVSSISRRRHSLKDASSTAPPATITMASPMTALSFKPPIPPLTARPLRDVDKDKDIQVQEKIEGKKDIPTELKERDDHVAQQESKEHVSEPRSPDDNEIKVQQEMMEKEVMSPQESKEKEKTISRRARKVRN